MFGLAERTSGGIDAQVQQINSTTRTELHSQLMSMPPERFEALTGELFLEHHPDAFAAKAVTLRGRKHQYIASTPEGMPASYAIPNTGLWGETNLSARSVQKLTRQLLELLGHREDELVIHCYAPST